MINKVPEGKLFSIELIYYSSSMTLIIHQQRLPGSYDEDKGPCT